MGKQLVKIVKEICLENQINLRTYSDEYILELVKENKKMYIYGNKFPNNNASIEQICNDKSGLSDLLEEYDIPHVHHQYFYTLDRESATFSDDTWQRMESVLEKLGDVVVKNNKGTGGKNVYKVSDKATLREKAQKIYDETKSVCLSPYINIKEEYRVLIVHGKIEYVFRKIRPFVIGDGLNSVDRLAQLKYQDSNINVSEELDCNYVPSKNEKIELSWKHNLGQGAIPELITDKGLLEKLREIAEKCARCLDLQFVSIDIIDDGALKVLEINSGVMIEKFSDYNEEYYNLAKGAVKKAIDIYLQ